MNNILLICLAVLVGVQVSIAKAEDHDALFRQCAEGYLSTIKKLNQHDLHYEIRSCRINSREEAFRGNMTYYGAPISVEVLSDGRFVRTIYRLPGETNGTIGYLGDKYKLMHSPDSKSAWIAPKVHNDAMGLFDVEIQSIGRVSNLLKDCIEGLKSYCYEGDSEYQGHKTHIFVINEHTRLTFNPEYGYQVISVDSSLDPARPSEWVYDVFYEEWSESPGQGWLPGRILCFSEHATERAHEILDSKVKKFNCNPITDSSDFTASLPVGTQLGFTINHVTQKTTITSSLQLSAKELSSVVLEKQMQNLQSAAYHRPYTLWREWRANPEAAAFLKPLLISGAIILAVAIGLLVWWFRRTPREPAHATKM